MKHSEFPGNTDSEKKTVVRDEQPAAQVTSASTLQQLLGSKVPDVTGSEKKIAEILKLANEVGNNVVSKPEVAKEHAAPRDLGRGGAEHKAIQKLIKESAEALNFRSIIEHQVLDGENYVDVWLQRDGASIACEVSVESPVSWEVDKTTKFIKAGFERIAIISPNAAQLEKLRGAIATRVTAEEARRVEYYEPDEFIKTLHTIQRAEQTTSAQPETRRGRKITRKFTKVSPHEAKQREEDAIRTLRETMSKKND